MIKRKRNDTLDDTSLKRENIVMLRDVIMGTANHKLFGSDRSSIFVAMCFLVEQLRAEKRVDICTTVRKLRSQRNAMIDTYAQYEFLHRAIVNYADLHRLSLESPSD
uniref:protein-tyrosine-phosphatase n=1 Tax=Phlebotomus papatasi TaxID=29031 RepID=A0A1B0DE13_PHLPP